jgi:hypothetical protein
MRQALGGLEESGSLIIGRPQGRAANSQLDGLLRLGPFGVTTCVVAVLGKVQLRSLCRGQAAIAFSSGEAEHYGLAVAWSEAIED